MSNKYIAEFWKKYSGEVLDHTTIDEDVLKLTFFAGATTIVRLFETIPEIEGLTEEKILQVLSEVIDEVAEFQIELGRRTTLGESDASI